MAAYQKSRGTSGDPSEGCTRRHLPDIATLRLYAAYVSQHIASASPSTAELDGNLLNTLFFLRFSENKFIFFFNCLLHILIIFADPEPAA